MYALSGWADLCWRKALEFIVRDMPFKQGYTNLWKISVFEFTITTILPSYCPDDRSRNNFKETKRLAIHRIHEPLWNKVLSVVYPHALSPTASQNKHTLSMALGQIKHLSSPPNDKVWAVLLYSTRCIIIISINFQCNIISFYWFQTPDKLTIMVAQCPRLLQLQLDAAREDLIRELGLQLYYSQRPATIIQLSYENYDDKKQGRIDVSSAKRSQSIHRWDWIESICSAWKQTMNWRWNWEDERNGFYTLAATRQCPCLEFRIYTFRLHRGMDASK